MATPTKIGLEHDFLNVTSDTANKTIKITSETTSAPGATIYSVMTTFDEAYLHLCI